MEIIIGEERHRQRTQGKINLEDLQPTQEYSSDEDSQRSTQDQEGSDIEELEAPAPRILRSTRVTKNKVKFGDLEYRRRNK